MHHRINPLIGVMLALGFILFTGLGLIIISLEIGSQVVIGSFYFYLTLVVLGLGFLLLLIGVFQSLSIIKQTRKLIDIFTEKGFSIEETKNADSIKPTRVIRQKMPEPIPDSQIPKPKSISTAPFSAQAEEPKPFAASSEIKSSESSMELAPSISLDDALHSIVDRYNTEKVKKSFTGWNETLVMRFPDIKKSYLYIISGSEGLEFKEGDNPEAAVQVEMDSDLFQKLITKQVNAIKAYSSGKMNVQGAMKDMLKLRKLMF